MVAPAVGYQADYGGSQGAADLAATTCLGAVAGTTWTGFPSTVGSAQQETRQLRVEGSNFCAMSYAQLQSLRWRLGNLHDDLGAHLQAVENAITAGGLATNMTPTNNLLTTGNGNTSSTNTKLDSLLALSPTVSLQTTGNTALGQINSKSSEIRDNVQTVHADLTNSGALWLKLNSTNIALGDLLAAVTTSNTKLTAIQSAQVDQLDQMTAFIGSFESRVPTGVLDTIASNTASYGGGGGGGGSSGGLQTVAFSTGDRATIEDAQGSLHADVWFLAGLVAALLASFQLAAVFRV